MSADVVEMLGRVPIFSSFSARDLRGLARDAKGREFASGASIVKKGDRGVGFYLILDGRVEVRRAGRRLATLRAGDFFGEMALFGEEPRSADVVALDPTRCLVLSRWEFWGFASDNGRLLRGMLEEMARRLAKSNNALSE